MEQISVLITDDHEIFRSGIVSVFEDAEDIIVCGEASDGAEAIKMAEELLPDIVLMDVHLPVVDGIAATRAITTRSPSVKIVVVTVSAEDKHLFEAIRAGAQGYLLKSASPGQLRDAVRAVSEGGVVISPELAATLVTEFKELESQVSPDRADYPSGLTDREMEVLSLLAEGLSNKDIADRLYISERTVKNHISNVLSKLHLENRLQAAIYALKGGYIGR